MDMIQVQELTYQAGKKNLLQALSFNCKPGTALGIIGPNGAGKSTLLRLLSGYLKPSKGQIWLQGQALEQLSARQRAQRIAVVSPNEQQPPFAITVEAYLRLGRSPWQNWLGGWTGNDQACVEKALQDCHLQAFREHLLSSLSSGEWQRVQLARALVQSPQLLLLDEPTSHLDIAAQIELMQLLQNKVQQGLSLIAVMHDLNLAAQYMQELLFLNQGQLQAAGPVAEVLRPEHLKAVYGLNWQVQHSGGQLLLWPDYQHKASG